MLRSIVFIPLFFIAFLGMLASGSQARDCHREVPCPLGDRSYHVLEPDGWDGVSPLPVMLHFHGWARQGSLIVKHQRIAGATRPRGVLLVAPNGLNRSWDFWQPESPDTGFAEAVLADVGARYPVDSEHIFVSGYSWGSAMAWRFACESSIDIAVLLAVSGTLDQGETCAQAPREVRHVHGLDDQVLDFPWGPNGDVTYPVEMWRKRLECGDIHRVAQWHAVPWLTHTRYAWECDEGRVSLDVHPASHLIPRGWFARQLGEILNTHTGR